MSVEIVTLSPDAWPAYRALRLEALQTEPQAFGTRYADMLERPEAFWRGRLEEAAVDLPEAAPQDFSGPPDRRNPEGKKSWLLFAREGAQLLGMIGAVIEAAEEDAPGAGGQAKRPLTAEIISVYVSPSARGRGVGRALMQAILEKVTQNGRARRAMLGVMSEQAAALALYQSFGFKVTGENRVLMGDGLEHIEYDMARDL